MLIIAYNMLLQNEIQSSHTHAHTNGSRMEFVVLLSTEMNICIKCKVHLSKLLSKQLVELNLTRDEIFGTRGEMGQMQEVLLLYL